MKNAFRPFLLGGAILASVVACGGRDVTLGAVSSGDKNPPPDASPGPENDACVQGPNSGGTCKSTVSCTHDSDCASLGSKCDPCAKLCGCGLVSGSLLPCGPSLACDAATQFCEISEGGASTSVSYGCMPLPSSCATSPTCACVQATAPGSTCSASGGGVTLTVYLP